MTSAQETISDCQHQVCESAAAAWMKHLWQVERLMVTCCWQVAQTVYSQTWCTSRTDSRRHYTRQTIHTTSALSWDVEYCIPPPVQWWFQHMLFHCDSITGLVLFWHDGALQLCATPGQLHNGPIVPAAGPASRVLCSTQLVGKGVPASSLSWLVLVRPVRLISIVYARNLRVIW